MSLWYYQDPHGNLAGPYASDVFHQLRETGVVRDTTLIWRTGWSGWTTFADIWIHGGPPTEAGVATVPAPATPVEKIKIGAVPVEIDEAKEKISQKPPPIPMRLEQPQKEETFEQIRYVECSLCHEKWAEHLLFGSGQLRVCASCLKAHEEKRKDRQRIRSRRSRLGTGTFIWVVRILLLGLVMAGILIFFFSYLKSSSQ